MRYLILSQYYEPEPVPKPHDLALALQEHGDEVEVITGFPNYPSGKLYSGYRLKFRASESVQGIPVTRMLEVPYHGRSTIGRLINYGSFMVSAPLGSIGKDRFDAAYVWHPPLTIGLAACAIALFRRVPFVYDVQDIWPESAVLSGMMKEGVLTRIASRLERFVYRRAAHILVVTEGARQNLIEKGVPPEKLSVMPHWIDESLFAEVDPTVISAFRTENGWSSDDFVFLFAGNLGMVQGLQSVLEGVRLTDRPARVVFVGDGAERETLIEASRSMGLGSRVSFIPRQPPSRIPLFMAASDALLIHLKRSQLSHWVIPTKTFAYLAAGRPIIMGMEGAAAELVYRAGAGLLAEPENPASLAHAMNALQRASRSERDEMGRCGRAFLHAHFSKKKVLQQYVELLERVARMQSAD